MSDFVLKIEYIYSYCVATLFTLNLLRVLKNQIRKFSSALTLGEGSALVKLVK